MQRLRHPFIIHFTAAFEDNGSMYLEMEYFAHGSLRHWIDTTQPDAAQKRSLLRQVLPLLGTRTCCQHRPTHVRCSAPLGYTIAPLEGIEMRELYITINVFSLFGPRFLIIQS